MMLIELYPNWVGAGGPGVLRGMEPAPVRTGVGITFDCPCRRCDTRAYIAFSNPLDGGEAHVNNGEPIWDRSGESFDDLTLTPSIQRGDGCGWHGFITNGEVIPA